MVIDSTGLNIFGKGEWKKQKHEPDKRQVWRMLHLTVGPTSHNIVAAEVSLENVHDTEVLPTLLNPQRRALGTVYTDCGYDLKACHELIMPKGAAACINAGLWEEGYPRNNAVLERGAAATPLEENIRLSAVLASGDSDVAV